MFILRTIRPNGTVCNTQIGDQYTVHARGSKLYNEYLEERSTDIGISCLIESPLIAGAIAIFDDYKAYILTESGKTFERLSELRIKDLKKFE